MPKSSFKSTRSVASASRFTTATSSHGNIFIHPNLGTFNSDSMPEPTYETNSYAETRLFPSSSSTESPAPSPILSPSSSPSAPPLSSPSESPSSMKSALPTSVPSSSPSLPPSLLSLGPPSPGLFQSPPSTSSTIVSTSYPSSAPSLEPSISSRPTSALSDSPSHSKQPSSQPSIASSTSSSPSSSNSPSTSSFPTNAPSNPPSTSISPTIFSSLSPSSSPSASISLAPSWDQSESPSLVPTLHASIEPSSSPSDISNIFSRPTTISSDVPKSTQPTSSPSSLEMNSAPAREGVAVGPEITTRLLMTMSGIDRIENEQQWGQDTSSFIMGYFNNYHIDNIPVGEKDAKRHAVFDVQVTVTLTEQIPNGSGSLRSRGLKLSQLGELTIPQHPQQTGLRLLQDRKTVDINYIQITKFKTSSTELVDLSYVIRAPFETLESQSNYLSYLQSVPANEGNYDNVTSVSPVTIWDAPPDPKQTHKAIGAGAGVGALLFVIMLFWIYRAVMRCVRAEKEDYLEEEVYAAEFQGKKSLEGSWEEEALRQSARSGISSGRRSKSSDVERRRVSFQSEPANVSPKNEPIEIERGMPFEVKEVYFGDNDQSVEGDGSITDTFADGSMSENQSYPSARETRPLKLKPMNSSSTAGSTQSTSLTNRDLIQVYAPPGKLGVVIEDPPGGGVSYVCDIRPNSVLYGKIKIGDKVLNVDDRDVRRRSAMEISEMLASRSSNPKRKLTLLRDLGDEPYDE